jgi:ABC-type antimicrobial peptide transport system permease subunit
MRRGLLLTGIGLGIGLAVAFGLARLLASFLYRISPTDALTFTAVPAIILTVGLVASAWPARQATRVDPLVALRHD